VLASAIIMSSATKRGGDGVIGRPIHRPLLPLNACSFGAVFLCSHVGGADHLKHTACPTTNGHRPHHALQRIARPFCCYARIGVKRRREDI